MTTRYACTVCGARFDTMRGYEAHAASAHREPNDRPADDESDDDDDGGEPMTSAWRGMHNTYARDAREWLGTATDTTDHTSALVGIGFALLALDASLRELTADRADREGVERT